MQLHYAGPGRCWTYDGYVTPVKYNESLYRRDLPKKEFMNPAYLSLTFQMGDFDHEIWQALLGQWPFESFYEEGNNIIGYIQDHDITEPLMNFIAESKGKYFSDSN